MARVKGTKQLGLALDAELLDAFKVFCETRKETMRAAIEMALRRHMANPPPPPIPVALPPLVPLPPFGQPDPAETQNIRIPGSKKKGKK